MEKVTLNLTYFKPSGKYHADGKLEIDIEMPWSMCI
ncbi:hypothetical protein Xhom_04428 [Xenorhabdus hominickii]|uniref:Uncharacterized protein n=1 Tax=Xenorhabdus hominickii TaxID=351679 RepID=A0A1V0M447_XENHO|nr:hypothetical protein [Xenorhabdus hominickii]PHM52351.1 hypothetical protein Xhom_04428 [Xenorhabdus hominickii]